MRAILLSLFLAAAPAAARAASTVQHVPAREVPSVARREIDSAKSSIHLYLYLFNVRASQPNSVTSQLAGALIRAHKRGVKVRVVLDAGAEAYDTRRKNDAAAQRLAVAGVPVFASSGPPLHAKTLIVDGETILTGSSNWSASAFGKNGEANTLIRDRKTAESLDRELSAHPKTAVQPVPVDGVFIPRDFLTAKTGLGAMAHAGDERALDAYLYLLQTLPYPPQEGGPADHMLFSVDAVLLARALRLEGPTENDDRRQIFKILKRLKENYDLIDYETAFDKDPTVRLYFNGVEGFLLPEAYFNHRWDDRLSLAAKSFLLISLSQSKQSPISPRWSVSVEVLAFNHHVSPWFIMQGSVDLRRQDLLEVEHGPLTKAVTTPRVANTYTPNTLYDPLTREAKLVELKEAHGEEKVAQAQALAAIVYEDMDVEGVEELINLENKNGPHITAQAADIMGEKNPDNPKRSMAYLLGTIKGLAARQPDTTPED